MAIQLGNEQSFQFDPVHFQQMAHRQARQLLKQFKKATKTHLFFHVAFFVLVILEFISLILFSTFFSHPSFLAISLGALFLTGFSYLVLRFYFQAKKPEQITLLKEQYLVACRQNLCVPRGDPQHHLSLSQAILKLISFLHNFERYYYLPPRWLHKTTTFAENFSARRHWEDVLKLKEQLLYAAIEEHLEQIRNAPTDLEVHASLANSYVALSKLYLYTPPPHRFFSKKNQQESLEQKFRTAVERAVEEFKILNEYAPKDPWVHAQLARSYRDLQMPEEEIHEYEEILKLRPDDYEILFRLGVLYFELGKNASGLQIYEKLKNNSHPKANELISHYGSKRLQELEENH